MRGSSVRRLGSMLAAAAAALWTVALPSPAVACQCFTPDSMAEVATQPRTIVIAGVPGALAPRGVPVRVDRWIRGHDPRPVVWLAAWSIGQDEAACDGPAPAVGVPLLLVLEMPPDGSDPYGGMCAQVSRLDDAAGQAALRDAVRAFGAGLSLAASATGPPAGASSVGWDVGQTVIVTGALTVGVVSLAGLVLAALLAGRRHRA